MSAPGISESEWVVASIVWDAEGLTSVEIVSRLTAGVKWKLKTVNTFLTRLVSKGVLKAERDGRAFRYYAEIPREQCVKAASKSFLHRVFGGAAAPLLMHFCETTELTDDEIAKLREMLNKKSPASARRKRRS